MGSVHAPDNRGWRWLLNHAQATVERITESFRRRRATPQAARCNDLYADGAIRHWNQRAAGQLNLDGATHNAMSGSVVEGDYRGSCVVNVGWDRGAFDGIGQSDLSCFR